MTRVMFTMKGKVCARQSVMVQKHDANKVYENNTTI